MSNVEAVSEMYQTAAALGYALVAPIGAEVTVLTIVDSEPMSSSAFIVLTEAYQSVTEAREALEGWCIDELENAAFPPWEKAHHQADYTPVPYSEAKESWLANHDVVEEHFKHSTMSFSIEITSVSPQKILNPVTP